MTWFQLNLLVYLLEFLDMKFLVIEDEKEISQFVKSGLVDLGADVEIYEDGQVALSQVQRDHYDAIVLDLQLPGSVDGFQFVESLRKSGNNTPVLILSSLKELEDRLRGLKLGGDDYLTKPFAMAELQLRVQNLIKRVPKASEATSLNFADVSLNRLTREVLRAGKKIDLQEREFLLLEMLMGNPNKIISKSLILKQVWNYDFDPQTNVVDVLVCRLRNKLEKDFPTRLIFTVRGVGYVMKSAQ
jgi:two-component system OmpR family response regulator